MEQKYILTLLLVLFCGMFSIGLISVFANENAEKPQERAVMAEKYVPDVTKMCLNGEVNVAEKLTSAEPPITEAEKDLQNVQNVEVNTTSPTNVGEISTNFTLSNDYLEKLEKTAGSYGCQAAFYYENLATGQVISRNENVKFTSASTIKAPYIKSLLAENVNLDEQIPLSKTAANRGAGVGLKPVGTLFSVRDLMSAAIIDSDNSAYWLLGEHFGYEAYNRSAAEVGVRTRTSPVDKYVSYSAKEQAALFKDIYNFSQADKNGAWLVEKMANASYSEQISAALPERKVAHKFGEIQGIVYHDCAIVFAENPYVLVILTDINSAREDRNAIFIELSQQIDEINENLRNNA
ncbi:MAG: serine hydrolase [Oscillospiraceae bacterium]